MKKVNELHRICSLLYGACLFTGSIYAFIYDISTSQAKFLGETKGYINIYKALLKVDWTKMAQGGCLLVFVFVL